MNTSECKPTYWWSVGKITPIWSEYSYRANNYVKQPIKDSEVAAWRAMGYTHSSFTGEMCVIKRHTTASGVFYAAADLVAQALQIPMKDVGCTLYRMKTCDIMPVHVDHFERYSLITGIERTQACRCLIMLEDAKPGHYLEIDGKGICQWSAGDFFVWSADTPHAAANIGVDDRYTLQITYHE